MVGAISPDGRWVAYASDESGVVQGQVRSFPEAERQAGWEREISREPMDPSGRPMARRLLMWTRTSVA